MLSLDAIDLKILTLLQDDGRLSNQALADQVALSPSACLRRARLLEESGAIAGYRAQLDAAIALDPHHISAYALTVEAGTPLAADPARHPDDDVQADEYQLATERLGSAGYEWYEISNWAKPGHECRHNLLYWSGGEYLAIGCAAHGHVGGRRFWNLRTPERYLTAIEEGRSPEAGSEELDEEGRRVEHLQLAIRTRDGVPAAEVPAGFEEQLEGLVERHGDRVVLTTEGRLLANEVAIRLGTVATNTFDLEGLDTSNYGTFTSGTFTPVTAFTTITPATEYQVGGGDADFIDTSVLLDNIKQQEVGPLNAQTVTIAIKKETVNGAGMVAVVAAARAGLDKVFRITLKDGSVRVFRGTPSIPNENVSVGGVGTGGFTVTVKRFLQEGAA